MFIYGNRVKYAYSETVLVSYTTYQQSCNNYCLYYNIKFVVCSTVQLRIKKYCYIKNYNYYIFIFSNLYQTYIFRLIHVCQTNQLSTIYFNDKYIDFFNHIYRQNQYSTLLNIYFSTRIITIGILLKELLQLMVIVISE